MKNVLQQKHKKNRKKYFKSKDLEKPHIPPIFLFYLPILRYQFPNGMITKICILLMLFFASHFINNFTNSVINCTQSK